MGMRTPIWSRPVALRGLVLAASASAALLLSCLVTVPAQAVAIPQPSYSYSVTINGQPLGLYTDTQGWDGSLPTPEVATTPETYITCLGTEEEGICAPETNADGTVVTLPAGTVIGTVSFDLQVGISISAPQDHDVSVLVDGGPTYTGECGPDACGSNQLNPVYYQTCVLPAGQSSVECQYRDITWHYGSFWYGWGDSTDFSFLFSDCTLTVTSGNNEVCANGDPVTGGFGYAAVDAFIPPGAGQYAGSSALVSGKSFAVEYEPIFKGAFTLVAKRPNGSLVRTTYLGVKGPAAYTKRFYCQSLKGSVTVLVRGTEHGHLQRSSAKTVTC
jgi:hypothetical protein